MGGLIPSQGLRKAIADSAVEAANPITEDQIQPSSLDLRLGEEAVRIRASFLPGSQSIAERLDVLEMYRLDLSGPDGAVLEPGAVYLIPVFETLRLPESWSGRTNPKSSIGRLDIFVRVIVEGAREYDEIPLGYRGKMWLEITPRAFAVRVRCGSRLAQLRLRASDPDRILGRVLGRILAENPARATDPIPVTVNVTGGPDGVIGWRARANAGLIDIDARAAYDPVDFWEPVRPEQKGGGLVLAVDRFHLLATQESVVVPPYRAAEMCAYNIGLGELRVHYAGFFDPGFGWRKGKALFSRAVLEVRPHEAPFLIVEGQIVGNLVFEDLLEPPDKLYGDEIGSSYQGQGLKLSRQFRSAS